MDSWIKLGIGFALVFIGWLLGWGKDWLNRKQTYKNILCEFEDIVLELDESEVVIMSGIKETNRPRKEILVPTFISAPVYDKHFTSSYSLFSAYERKLVRLIMKHINIYNEYCTKKLVREGKDRMLESRARYVDLLTTSYWLKHDIKALRNAQGIKIFKYNTANDAIYKSLANKARDVATKAIDGI